MNETHLVYSASQQTVTIGRMAVNVFNWCCWAVVLAVIVHAQPTVDETVTCSASTFEEVVNMVKLIASNQQEKAKEIMDDIKDVKSLLESESSKTNDTSLEEIAKDVKTLLESESGQINDTRLEEIAKDVKTLLESESGKTNDTRLEEIAKDVKTLLESESGKANDTRLEEIAKEIKDVKQLLHTPRPIELDAGSPSKQALASALVCEYLLCF